jgi:hypothetical protein
MTAALVVLEPVAAPEPARRLVAAAGSLPFHLSALDAPGSFEEADDPLAEALRRWLDRHEWSALVPATGWRKLAADHELAVVGSGVPPHLVTVTFECWRRAGFWTYWNSCHGGGVRSWRHGVEASSWRLDPGEQPLPTATRLRALVTERTCASGQSADGRVQPPDRHADHEELVLTFYVTPLDGEQECPGNPETAVIVDLGEAVGDRSVRDGAVPAPRII